MKTTRAAIATSALAALSPAYPADVHKLEERELQLGGIRMGQVRGDVIRTLGRPTATSRTDEGERLDYPGLKVFVGAGTYGVFDLEATGAKVCTPSGICPGSTQAELLAKYGSGRVANRVTGKFIEYQPYDSPCWLQVSVEAG